MLDNILSELLRWTALPDLHPAMVHFPIALLCLAVVADGIALFSRGEFIERFAVSLLALGTVGGALAFWSGDVAARSLIHLRPITERLVEDHRQSSWWALVVFGALALARLLVYWNEVRSGERRKILRVFLLGIAVWGLVCLADAADSGGALVYRHGIAVQTTVGEGRLGFGDESPPPNRLDGDLDGDRDTPQSGTSESPE